MEKYGKKSKQNSELSNEISNLRCKLDMKCKALMILSQDLMNCKRERDEFKLMAEQLRERHSTLKRRMDALGPSLCDIYGKTNFPNDFSVNNATFAQVVCQLRQQNKSLLYEVEELRMKLSDAEGDVKLLREQINVLRFKSSDEFAKMVFDQNGDSDLQSTKQSKSIQELMSQIEALKNRCEVQEKDLKAILDEKEELVVSREAYKAKVERLNERLNEILRLSHNEDKSSIKIVDIDSLITENKFLHEKIAQLEEEKSVADKTLLRFKNMVEKGNLKKNVFNLKSKSCNRKILNAEDLTSTNVISTKEVQSFIASNTLNDLHLTEHNLVHLKSLVIALFEALSDKSSAFSLQKKNNKLLGNRIQELENKIKDLQAKEKFSIFTRDRLSLDSTADFSTDDTSGSDAGSSGCNENSVEVDDEEDEICLPPELEKLVKDEMEKLNDTRISEATN